MVLRILLATALLVAAAASAEETLWISDFEDVEPGNPDPTWSNPDFIVESVGGVNAYTAPWGYSGYSVYQTSVPPEHWLELRVRVDNAQIEATNTDIIYRHGDFRLAQFGYLPSDGQFWTRIPDAWCGVYYADGVMEPGAWYRWLIHSAPSDYPSYYRMEFKWWREGDVEPGWLITREEYLCLDFVWMEEANEVSIVCSNASEFYVDWVEARVPEGREIKPVIAEPSYGLSTVFPNPANPVADITYTIAQRGRVALRVFNILGQEVAVLVDGIQPEGEHKVHFDGSNLPSGIYICTLVTDGYSASKKLILLK